jgi:hypothetical protein
MCPIDVLSGSLSFCGGQVAVLDWVKGRGMFPTNSSDVLIR